jgi:hypothetical protein
MLHQDQATGKMQFTHHYMRAAKSRTGSRRHTGKHSNILAPAHRGPSLGSSIEPKAWRTGSVDVFPKIVTAPSVASTGGMNDGDSASSPAIFRPRHDETLDQLLLEGSMQEGGGTAGGGGARGKASRPATVEWRWSEPQEAAMDSMGAAAGDVPRPGDVQRHAERQMAAALLLKGEDEEQVWPSDGLSPAAATTIGDEADDDGNVDRESECVFWTFNTHCVAHMLFSSEYATAHNSTAPCAPNYMHATLLSGARSPMCCTA